MSWLNIEAAAKNHVNIIGETAAINLNILVGLNSAPSAATGYVCGLDEDIIYIC
jgi:hypothetical protein